MRTHLLTKQLSHLAHDSNGHRLDTRDAGTPKPVRLSKHFKQTKTNIHSEEDGFEIIKEEAIAISAENSRARRQTKDK
ncbi:hypothetical protein AVEN_112626-1 [Araneus ventricosus]|uniref:Uncharacterized protein n=1 Tax=Araneus ventricosus TaxID=182803 RepID=A0A4Y1ZQ48_ARAVE|nr:hypothetical protein AVEN_110344-1 [Araneus ventricosus]GBL61403.1 hypothetical protein AVEN_112626-1 [Araneus ventricosus]